MFFFTYFSIFRSSCSILFFSNREKIRSAVVRNEIDEGGEGKSDGNQDADGS